PRCPTLFPLHDALPIYTRVALPEPLDDCFAGCGQQPDDGTAVRLSGFAGIAALHFEACNAGQSLDPAINGCLVAGEDGVFVLSRSEEHTSELQSREDLV